MKRLEFRFIQINSRDWALELNGELLENKLGEPLVFTSRTKAVNKFLRILWASKPGADFTLIAEREDKDENK